MSAIITTYDTGFSETKIVREFSSHDFRMMIRNLKIKGWELKTVRQITDCTGREYWATMIRPHIYRIY